jgi:hypothetical protein
MSRHLKGGDLWILPCAFSVALSYGEFDPRAIDAIIRMSVAEMLQMLRGSACPGAGFCAPADPFRAGSLGAKRLPVRCYPPLLSAPRFDAGKSSGLSGNA